MHMVTKTVNLRNFLDENDNFAENANFLGFSTGKRGCPGKYVAIKTLYAFFANLLINYKLKLKNHIEEIEQEHGFVLCLKNPIPLLMEGR